MTPTAATRNVSRRRNAQSSMSGASTALYTRLVAHTLAPRQDRSATPHRHMRHLQLPQRLASTSQLSTRTETQLSTAQRYLRRMPLAHQMVLHARLLNNVSWLRSHHHQQRSQSTLVVHHGEQILSATRLMILNVHIATSPSSLGRQQCQLPTRTVQRNRR